MNDQPSQIWSFMILYIPDNLCLLIKSEHCLFSHAIHLLKFMFYVYVPNRMVWVQTFDDDGWYAYFWSKTAHLV